MSSVNQAVPQGNKNQTVLLHEATNEQTAAKIGEFGDPGSGKTTTAALLALGISKTYCNNAPVAIMDTERASDFVIPIFRTEGVKLLVHKSKAFADMMTVLSEAEKSGCCCLIIDSVTHAWDELVDSYCKKKNISKPEFHHWKDIKAPWKSWTDRYLTSPLHIIVVGRVGYEYEYQVNDETKKKELIKGESRMRAEGQFGYEPHLLIEFERQREMNGQEHGGKFKHIAHILKDRSWALNGASLAFNDQATYTKGYYEKVFGAFRPHFDLLNIGGTQQALDGANSEGMFPNGHSEYYQREQEKKISLEEIAASVQLLWPGQGSAEKALRIRVMEAVWGVRAWSAIEAMPLSQINDGLKLLRTYEARAKETPVDTEAGVLDLLADIKKPGAPTILEMQLQKSVDAQAAKGINLPPLPSLHLVPDDDEQEIIYARKNGSFILSGATFAVKENLKEKFEAKYIKSEKSWSMPARHFAELEEICQKAGLRMVAASPDVAV